jgi:hypothetical protein
VLDDVVAQLVRAGWPAGNYVGETGQTRSDRLPASLDEPIGIEQEG